MFNEPAVLYCCITAKYGKTKNGLLKYVSCSCWTHLRETFHIRLFTWLREQLRQMLKYVGNKAKGRISKRVFQENKCQNLENFISKNLAYFLFLKHPFWDLTFCLITDESSQKWSDSPAEPCKYNISMYNIHSYIFYNYIKYFICNIYVFYIMYGVLIVFVKISRNCYICSRKL